MKLPISIHFSRYFLYYENHYAIQSNFSDSSTYFSSNSFNINSQNSSEFYVFAFVFVYFILSLIIFQLISLVLLIVKILSFLSNKVLFFRCWITNTDTCSASAVYLCDQQTLGSQRWALLELQAVPAATVPLCTVFSLTFQAPLLQTLYYFIFGHSLSTR